MSASPRSEGEWSEVMLRSWVVAGDLLYFLGAEFRVIRHDQADGYMVVRPWHGGDTQLVFWADLQVFPYSVYRRLNTRGSLPTGAGAVIRRMSGELLVQVSRGDSKIRFWRRVQDGLRVAASDLKDSYFEVLHAGVDAADLRP